MTAKLYTECIISFRTLKLLTLEELSESSTPHCNITASKGTVASKKKGDERRIS